MFKEGDRVKIINPDYFYNLWKFCDVLVVKKGGANGNTVLLAVPKGCGFAWSIHSQFPNNRSVSLNDKLVELQFDSYEMTFYENTFKKTNGPIGEQLFNKFYN